MSALFHEPLQILEPFRGRHDTRRNLIGLSRDALKTTLTEAGLEAFRAKQIWQWIYWHGVTDFERMTNVAKQCPKPSGDVLCQQVNYAAIAQLEPGEGGDDGGSNTGIIAVIVVLVLGAAAFLLVRWRRSRGGREPLEMET